MLFRPHHIPLIREGTKTATRRDWADDYHRPSEGDVRRPVTEIFTSDDECDRYIQATDHYQERLGATDTEDARREIGYTLADFRAAWMNINGEYNSDQVVDVVEFEYIGRRRPADSEVTTV